MTIDLHIRFQMLSFLLSVGQGKLRKEAKRQATLVAELLVGLFSSRERRRSSQSKAT